MRFTRIAVKNFKSLKQVDFTSPGFAVLVGPNASGKSNFADAIDFVSDVYRHGLEIAVAKKGGYENIAFRRIRRSRAAIVFTIAAEAEKPELETLLRRHRLLFRTPTNGRSLRLSSLHWEHSFSFKTQTEDIGASFSIYSERLRIWATRRKKNPDNEDLILDIIRASDDRMKINSFSKIRFSVAFKRYLIPYPRNSEIQDEAFVGPQQLITEMALARVPALSIFTRKLGYISVHRLSPDTSRRSGVPTPNPEMSERGDNLPAVIDWLIKTRPDLWESVMSSMHEIVPDLEHIAVKYLHTKTLGLFFKEKGIGKSWPAEDVSDGTIQTLGLLAASADPRSSGLVIEEPENSVHPWVVQSLLHRLSELAKHKPIIITTHSPVILDNIDPGDLWLVFKVGGCTEIKRACDLDANIVEGWKRGDYKLSEYLGSGLILEAVPGGIQ